MDKVHTFDEVKQHSNKGDCWLIISGKVYDVSPFLLQHPGGEDVLVNATGKDATEEFEDIGHSYRAKELMVKYCIGTIDTSTIPSKHQQSAPTSNVTAPAKKSSGGGFGSILLILIPLLIVALALGYQKYGKFN